MLIAIPALVNEDSVVDLKDVETIACTQLHECPCSYVARWGCGSESHIARMVTESGIVLDIKGEKFGTDGWGMFYGLKGAKKDVEASFDSYFGDPAENILDITSSRSDK